MGREAQSAPAPRDGDLEHIGCGQLLDDAPIQPPLLLMLRRHLEQIRPHRLSDGYQFLDALIAKSAFF